MAATILTFPQKPEDRLRAALRSLEAAMREQQEAIGEFRDSLAGLGGAMASVESRLTVFQSHLGQASIQAEAARDISAKTAAL
ncbi:hypothetical protein [Roseococcus sp. YIM B11640]|uniref:hypothetical protein n=1 Tax=Roseococcus sp. YIM B11640 TaxID=3133973 RepID=UPI003C7CDFA8